MAKKKQFEKPKPKEPNSFEKLVSEKNATKAKKLQKSKSIIMPQVKANTGNKFKVRDAPMNLNLGQPQKKNLFDLDSDQEEQKELKNWKITHKGKEINDDDFREQVSVSSSEEHVPADVVKNFHFDGFTKEKQKKTRADVYKEIIVNSKKRKLEKMQQKEDNAAKVQELNNVYPLIAEHLPKIQNRRSQVEDDYTTLAKMFSHEEKVIATTVVSNNPQKEKQRERRRRQLEEAERSSNDESSEANDDEDDVPDAKNKEREKRILKPLRKIQKVQKMIETIKQVKGSKAQDDFDDELDQLSGEDYDDEEDFEDEEGEDGDDGDDGEDGDDGDDGEDGEDGEEDDNEEESGDDELISEDDN